MRQDTSPDDLWVRRLRERADEVVPDIPTDAASALRGGRRRRTRRRASVVTGVAALAVAIALGAAPAARLLTADALPAALPEDLEVVIDRTDGTITLPLDRYSLTETERSEVLHASALAMRACAAERGYDVTDFWSGTYLTPSTVPDPIGDLRFGVWWMPSAREFGYVTRSVPHQRYGVSTRDMDDTRTRAQQTILDECGRTPTVQQFWPSTDLGEPAPDFVRQAAQSPAGQLVIRDWDACLQAHGLRSEDLGLSWAVTDAEGRRRSGDTPTEYGEPLGPDSAVVDAGCKTDVDLVPRLTRMVAERQAPFIAAHRGELTAVRAALDESLRRARAYVAQHG
ncbi:hypothetical protein [Cellulomonas sp. URHB0016]